MPPELTHRTLETNGIHLHAVESGPPDGPLTLLLHGFPEYWYSWRHQLGPLADAGLRVVAPDQRGYNLSDKPPGLPAYRMDVLARDVVALIEAYGQDKAFLVGHDWGGVVAWVTAVLYPERVAKLAVLNAPYPPVALRTLPRHPEQILRSTYMVFFQLDGLAEAMLRSNNWEILVDGMRRSSRPGTFSDQDFEGYRQAWWRRGAMTGMLNWYRALFRRPLRLPRAPRLSMPTLLLWGARDVALGRELAGASLQLCDQGELVFFEDATHWLQHEEARRVNSYLIDLAKQA